MVIVGTRLGALALLVAAHFMMVTVGCNSAASDTSSKSADPTPAKSSSTPSTPISGKPTSASSSAAPTAHASTAPAATSPLAGKWTASFESKKAKVAQDPGVADPAWAKEDGSEASGPGTIELTIAEDGTVSGKLSGSLGEATIAGMADEKGAAGTFTPSSTEASAMHGTLELALASDKLTGSLRASSGDAHIVRSATLSFARAK